MRQDVTEVVGFNGTTYFDEATTPIQFHATLILSDMKEGNVLFIDALSTFYLLIYGVIHMVKDNSDSEIGNELPPHGLFFPISGNGYFICITLQTG